MSSSPASVPLVSIIVNCRNSEAYLAACLDSIYAQTYPAWEIILWDNASIDRTPEIARRYDSRLRYFRSEATATLGQARNFAMARVQGKYLAFLDSDDQWLPFKLEEQVKLLEAQDDIDLVYGNFFKQIMPQEDRLVPGLKGPQPEGDVFGRFLRHYPVNLQTVMIRMEAVRRSAALFDERFQVSEEFDLFMRILYRSKARYIPVPLAIYRIHPGMSSQKHIERYPLEMSMFLEKIKKMDPLIERQHASALRYFMAKIAYAHAKVAAARNDLAAASEALAPYKSLDMKFMALYLLTFFPSTVWAWVHRCRMENRFGAGL